MPEQKVNMRLLAAIMFADMVGYTRLMQEDEQKAKDLRDQQREVLEGCIANHGGQVMQYYGDGTLSMFGSAIEAVKCAKEIQLILNREPKVPVRIGIHVGDVVYDDEGIYGDAVNLAARVQALSVPGGVMISEKVFDEVKNHPGIRVEGFGKHELKNVFDPVGIYALANEGLEVPKQEDVHEQTGSNKNSVAVLPFVNMSSDEENEYFSDGITEEIINALVKVDGLHVSARTSVFAYKNKNADIREIGKELNVSTILEGSVRRFGDRVRVTAQLIKTEDGFHIWSEVYDREMRDIFAVQDEISLNIAEKLQDNFEISRDNIYKADTDSIDAYNAYLQALFYWNKRTPEDTFKAIEFHQKAIKKCSTYSRAYSGIAHCYSFLGIIGHLRGEESFSKAEEYALKSIELNDTQADSYVALGLVNLYYHWDYKRAEANLRKAITLEPENLDAREALGTLYRVIGRYDKMLHHYDVSVRIEPLSLPANLALGGAYWLTGQHKKADKIYDKIISLDPNFRSAYERKALLYFVQGKYEKAIVELDKYISLIKGDFRGSTQMAFIQAKMGNIEEAEKVLEDVHKRQEDNPQLNLSLDFAVIYTALDQHEKALKYLMQAVEEKLGSILFINSIEPFEPLRKYPEYAQIIEAIGLPMESIVAE